MVNFRHAVYNENNKAENTALLATVRVDPVRLSCPTTARCCHPDKKLVIQSTKQAQKLQQRIEKSVKSLSEVERYFKDMETIVDTFSTVDCLKNRFIQDKNMLLGCNYVIIVLMIHLET